MKSLRYLLVLTWVGTMASLGLFSDIGALQDLFAACHYGGDANLPGIALADTRVSLPIEAVTQTIPVTASPQKKAKTCQKQIKPCSKKQKKRCKWVCNKKSQPISKLAPQSQDTAVVAVNLIYQVLKQG